MIEIDYYELLEIEKTSDKATIKKAYRKLAMQYHPDKNPNDKEAEEKFKTINIKQLVSLVMELVQKIARLKTVKLVAELDKFTQDKVL